MALKITVEVDVSAPVGRVWNAWNTPADIVQWNAASRLCLASFGRSRLMYNCPSS